MQRKTMMGLAAVAAVAGLLYLRSRNAAAETAGIGGVLSSNAGTLNAANGAASWTSALAGLLSVNNTKPLQVADSKAPVTPVSPTAVTPGPVGGTSFTSTVSATGLRTYSDGSTYQLTPGELHVYQLNQKGQGFNPGW